MPSLSTLWYRLVHIPSARWHAFLEWLAAQGIAQERAQRAAQGEPTSAGLVLVDGTGAGYDMPFYQRLWRGEQNRKFLPASRAGTKGRFRNLPLHQLRKQRLELGEAGAHAFDIVDDRFPCVGD